jgi:hypothetical protein
LFVCVGSLGILLRTRPLWSLVPNLLQICLAAPSPCDSLSLPPFVQVRAGAGGAEASLFASELLAMYAGYAVGRGWEAEACDYLLIWVLLGVLRWTCWLGRQGVALPVCC